MHHNSHPMNRKLLLYQVELLVCLDVLVLLIAINIIKVNNNFLITFFNAQIKSIYITCSKYPTASS